MAATEIAQCIKCFLL